MNNGAFPMNAEGSRPRTEHKWLLGHPRGLFYLAVTEIGERSAFYGMSALLLLYMVQHLLSPHVLPHVVGLSAIRAGLESVLGPLSDRAFASQVLGLYLGLVYLIPPLGGFLADRWLGQRRAVILGGVLLAIGHGLMIVELSFVFALCFLIVGAGLLKSNMAVQVGRLYSLKDESGRTRAFAIYSAGVNIGMFVGPLICSALAQLWGWQIAFATNAILMGASLAVYWAGLTYLPVDAIQKKTVDRPKLSPTERGKVAVLIALALIQVVAVIAYLQEVDAGILFIQDSVTRKIGGMEIPASAFTALKGLFLILLAVPVVTLWRAQQRRGREPGDQTKLAIGYGFIALAYIILLVPGYWIDTSPAVKVSVIWPILFFLMNSIGYLYAIPPLLALYSSASPKRSMSTMMGLFYGSNFLSGVAAGYLATWWDRLSHVKFFCVHAGLAIVALVITVLLAPMAERLLAATSAPLQNESE